MSPKSWEAMMATLFYGSTRIPIRVDEVLRRHLKAVMIAKMRRNESFVLTWIDSLETGRGQRSVWVSSVSELEFEFDSAEPLTLDPSMLNRMTVDSIRPDGIELIEAMLGPERRLRSSPA